MKKDRVNDPLDIMGTAYETMLERSIEDVHKIEDKTGPALHDLIDSARQKAIQLGELSEDEAEKLAEYLKRDLADAAFYLTEKGRELKDWFGFEDSLIGQELLQRFMQAADQTTVGLNELKIELAAQAGYRTGEVTGPGTLTCDGCGEMLHFHRAGRIPPCPKCHKADFHRLVRD
jgi:hypothetical protein